MKTTKIILFGTLAWFLIFSLFAVLNLIPVTAQSETLQGVIVGIGVVPFGIFGAWLYYRKNEGHGLKVGALMLLVAMVLDALITVPLIEMPLHGRNHLDFFTYPLLWILVTENILVIYAYWAFKVKPAKTIRLV